MLTTVLGLRVRDIIRSPRFRHGRHMGDGLIFVGFLRTDDVPAGVKASNVFERGETFFEVTRITPLSDDDQQVGDFRIDQAPVRKLVFAVECTADCIRTTRGETICFVIGACEDNRNTIVPSVDRVAHRYGKDNIQFVEYFQRLRT